MNHADPVLESRAESVYHPVHASDAAALTEIPFYTKFRILPAFQIPQALSARNQGDRMNSAPKILLTVSVLLPVLFFSVVNSGSCAQMVGDEPTKYMSQEGLEKLSRQAGQKTKDNAASRTDSGNVSDNPGFLVAKDIIPNNPAAKDIDSILRPVLVKLFKEAKLVSATGPETPKRDKEVVEDRLVYSVKRMLLEKDGDNLHRAFRSSGFVASPRLGRKPTHSRGNVYMSLMRSTSHRGYSFVIVVDTTKQQIEIESYKLGSKYDRMM